MSNELNQGIGDLVVAVTATGATPPVIVQSVGVSPQTAATPGVVRNGKGDFTVNFPLSPCDLLSRNCQITSSTAANIVAINSGSDTSAGVLVFDAAGAAVDGGFSLAIWRTAIQ